MTLLGTWVFAEEVEHLDIRDFGCANDETKQVGEGLLEQEQAGVEGLVGLEDLLNDKETSVTREVIRQTRKVNVNPRANLL